MVIRPFERLVCVWSQIIGTCQVLPLFGIGVMAVTGVLDTVVVHNQAITHIAEVLAGVHIATDQTQTFHGTAVHHPYKGLAVYAGKGIAVTPEMSHKRILGGTHRGPMIELGRHRVLGPFDIVVAILRVHIDIVGEGEEHVLAMRVHGVAVKPKLVTGIDAVDEVDKGVCALNRERVVLRTLRQTHSGVQIPDFGVVVAEESREVEVALGVKHHRIAIQMGTGVGNIPDNAHACST